MLTARQITKSISRFLAQSRHRNDVSNRAEFLVSLAEKRRRLGDPSATISSCARTDARPLDRDVQMKFDVAKNEDGPLKRTMRVKSEGVNADALLLEETRVGKRRRADGHGKMDEVTAERHPGLNERLSDVESHLAVRYGASLTCSHSRAPK